MARGHEREAETEARWAEACARFPDVPPGDLSEDGCIRLVAAFWALVHHDLACRKRDAIAWLDTDDFAAWAAIAHQDPDTARAVLQERVVGNPAYRRRPEQEAR